MDIQNGIQIKTLELKNIVGNISDEFKTKFSCNM